MNSQVKLYRFVEPINPSPPANTELHGYEYRGFLITRAHIEYLFWKIETLDGKEPPKVLSGSYTVREKAQEAIDAFITIEAQKQKAMQ